MFTHRKSLLALGVALVAIALPTNAIAQSGQSQAPDESSEEASNENSDDREIIVTAQRREQTLLDVPIAVSVIFNKQLENALATNVEDIQRLVPSLTVSGATSPTGSSIRIRGVGTNVFSATVEPSVSIVVDGVPLPRNDIGLVELADIERVEVLKGPQGTLFGKNASAGVLSYTTKAPSDEFEGLIRARGTTDEDYRVDGSFSFPLGDQAGLRLTGFYNNTADYQRNVFTGNDIGGNEAYGGRARFVLEPNDSFRLAITADFYELDSNCCGIPLRSAAGQGILDLAQGITPGEENVDVSADLDPINTMSQWGTALELSWDIGGVNLTSLTGFRDWNTGGNLADADFFAADGMNSSVVGGTGLQQQAFQDAVTLSQELRLTPISAGPLDFVLGAFYFRSKLDRFFDRDIQLCFGPSPAAAPRGSACAAPFALNQFFTLETDTENMAIFGDASYEIVEGLRLIAGARLLRDELSFETDTSNGIVGGDTVTDTAFIGRAGLQYDLTPDLTSFLTYSRGYKGAAFDATLGITNDVLAGGAVAPETSDAFEFAIRGYPFGDRSLFVDFSVFHNIYNDFQVQAFDPDNAGNTRLLNAGRTTTTGAELAINLALGEVFTLNAAAQYLDAQFDDFPGAGCFFGQTEAQGCVVDQFGRSFQDISGQTVPNAPEWKLSVTPRFDVPLANGSNLFAQAIVSYQSEVQFQTNQDPGTIQEAYALVDLNAGYRAPDGRFTITVFAQNLFDQFYTATIGRTFVNDPGGLFQIVPRGADRRIGAQIEFGF